MAQFWAAKIQQTRRDVLAVHEHAEACVTLALAQGFPQHAAHGMGLRGWALVMQGQSEAGLAQVRQGLAACRAIGPLGIPDLCLFLANISYHLGHTEDGLQALAEAHVLVEQREERWWEAEVCRLRGVARRQQAKSLELRAAMSLARLWQQQGKRSEAHELLVPVYGWFAEGFDTADLLEAKALLEEPA
jgi:hypothetical protein